MRVSLIITTYNRPDALFLVLKSVKIQTILPDEIIIADDGSNDMTKECVADFNKSSTLKLIHSWQQDKGFRVAKSRNKAIAKSTCDYIILIDGDMILHHRFIEDHLYHAELGYFVQGSRILLSEEASRLAFNKAENNFSFFSKGLSNRQNSIYSLFLAQLFLKKKNLLKGIKTCNMGFYRQDCLNINGFNNQIEGWGREDSEFIVRLFNSGINRKHVYFNLIQYHLWHKESARDLLAKNEKILQNTIKNKLLYCDSGLNKYL